jgi:pimeloyl-ACP methyl ester carboxylesterase
VTLHRVQLDDLTLTYREAGPASAPPVLLLHGWPTSSFLWRRVMLPIAEQNRVIVPDMPGFGGSSKPTSERYRFSFFERALDGLLDQLGIGSLAIAGHDLGGPIAMHWALRHPERVTKVALLNTLVYPEFSEAVLQFVQAIRVPAERERLTSAQGLEETLRLGLSDPAHLTPEVLAGVLEPFRTDDDRLALAAAAIGLEAAGFAEIAKGLPSLKVPLRLVYGEHDRVLPYGHFLQEEAPEQVGQLLARFFAG